MGKTKRMKIYKISDTLNVTEPLAKLINFCGDGEIELKYKCKELMKGNDGTEVEVPVTHTLKGKKLSSALALRLKKISNSKSLTEDIGNIVATIRMSGGYSVVIGLEGDITYAEDHISFETNKHEYVLRDCDDRKISVEEFLESDQVEKHEASINLLDALEQMAIADGYDPYEKVEGVGWKAIMGDETQGETQVAEVEPPTPQVQTPKVVYEGKLKIFNDADIIDERMTEDSMTAEELFTTHSLDGELVIGDPEFSDERAYFYFGPSIGNEGISDYITMYKYLETLFGKLGYVGSVGEAENYHSIVVRNESDYDAKIKQLVQRFKRDGYVVNIM